MVDTVSEIQEVDAPDDLDNPLTESNQKDPEFEELEHLEKEKSFHVKVNLMRFFLIVAFIGMFVIGAYYGIRALGAAYNYFFNSGLTPAANQSAPSAQSTPTPAGRVILQQPGASVSPGPVRSDYNVIPL